MTENTDGFFADFFFTCTFLYLAVTSTRDCPGVSLPHIHFPDQHRFDCLGIWYDCMSVWLLSQFVYASEITLKFKKKFSWSFCCRLVQSITETPAEFSSYSRKSRFIHRLPREKQMAWERSSRSPRVRQQKHRRQFNQSQPRTDRLPTGYNYICLRDGVDGPV